MKISEHSFSFALFLLLFSLNSCTKDANNNAQQSSIMSGSTSNLVVSGDTTILTLQPGAADGQDAYVNYEPGIHIYAQSNYNYDPELVIASWTNSGALLYERAFIRFDGLSNIPTGANIISAKMYLYGLDPNTSLGAPQGNSIYPHTPYSAYPNNGCLVIAVTKDWTEDSIKWNNKPGLYTTPYDAVIDSSTSQWNYNAVSDVTKLVSVMNKKKVNHGFCIRLQNENIYRSILFSSSEANDASKHPKMVVKYTM